MNPQQDHSDTLDAAPGAIGDEEHDIWQGVRSNSIGFVLSVFLTAAAFYLTKSSLLWEPGIPVALAVLAVAQIGVHLVFFVHLTSAEDNVNNIMALAFGTLIVGLLIIGTLWIMLHLGENLMPAPRMGPMLASPLGVTVEGVVEPPATAPVEARIEGVLATVGCEPGARVEAGQICARLEREPLEQEALQANAALRTAEARLKRDEDRLAALNEHPAGAKARRAAQAIRAQKTADEAMLAKARDAAQAATAKLEKVEIFAPGSGVVVARNAEIGQRVSPSQQPPLFLIDPNPGQVDVVTKVGVDAAKGLKVGAAVMASTGSPHAQSFSGVVASIGAPDAQTRSVAVRVSLADPEGVLKAGTAVSLHVPAQ